MVRVATALGCTIVIGSYLRQDGNAATTRKRDTHGRQQPEGGYEGTR